MLLIVVLIYFGFGRRYHTCKLPLIDDLIEITEGGFIHFDLDLASYHSRKFYNERQENGVKAYFPSGYWLENEQKFIIAVRIFVFDREKSHLYLSYFDKNWKQITTPSNFSNLVLPTIVPIPLEMGPEDEKMFKTTNNEIFLSFHRYDLKWSRVTSLISLNDSTFYDLTLNSYPKEGYNKIIPLVEKNWSPIYTEKGLFMVYSYNPFQLMDCSSIAICYHVVGSYKHDVGKIKPATQFERYKNTNYYFGFAWKHIYLEEIRYYRPVLVILYVDPKTSQYELIYISEPIHNIDQFQFESTDLNEGEGIYVEAYKKGRIVMITSIASFDPESDSMILLGNLWDQICFHLTIKGFDKIISKVIFSNEMKYYLFNQ